MKNIIKLIPALLLIFILTSCEYDNYDAPSISFTGRLTYNGQNFMYDGNPAHNVLRIYQKGFGKMDTGVALQINETGSFSELLFAGDYWLTLNNQQYPFEFAEFESHGTGLGYDSVYLNIQSNTIKNIEITPYFIISDFNVAVEDNDIVFRCHVAKNEETNATPPNVIFGRAYISTSSIVNSATKCTKSKRAVISNSGDIEISIPVSGNAPSYRETYLHNYRDYAYCRIAIELNGIQQYYLFSETKKLEGIPQ
jgi:hypothetical protein